MESKVGAWSTYQPLTETDVKAFELVAGKIGLGVTREPALVKTQVVAGVNYKFLTVAMVVHPNAQPYWERISAFIAPDQSVEIKSIEKICCPA